MGAWSKFRAAVLSIAGTAILTLFGCEEQKYPSGRDTKESFGDGRFQILRSATPELELWDCESNTEVAGHVRNWTERGDCVFVVDFNGNCWKVKYRSGAVVSFEKPDAAEDADRGIFENLLKSRPVSATPLFR